jgi:hypothetical protein
MTNTWPKFWDPRQARAYGWELWNYAGHVRLRATGDVSHADTVDFFVDKVRDLDPYYAAAARILLLDDPSILDRKVFYLSGTYGKVAADLNTGVVLEASPDYLGVSTVDVIELRDTLGDLLQPWATFDITLVGTNVDPDPRPSRILYVDTHKELDNKFPLLDALAASLEPSASWTVGLAYSGTNSGRHIAELRVYCRLSQALKAALADTSEYVRKNLVESWIRPSTMMVECYLDTGEPVGDQVEPANWVKA